MKGVVLCGGQSLRMGKDKGLLIGSKKITWAQQAFSLLSKFDLEVAFSVNKNQYPSYKRVFFSHKLMRDNPALNITGPLLGIMSAHLEYPGEDLLVLACDMIEMNLEVLTFLNNQYEQQPGFDAYLFKGKTTAEPLCAIYSASGLEQIVTKTKAMQFSHSNIKEALDELNVLGVPIKPEWKKAFTNMNTANDLKGS